MFESRVSEEFGVKWLHLKGRIDSMSAPEIQRQIDDLVLAGVRTFVSDFEEVNYISSAGLRVFLSGQKKLKKAGGEVLLFGMGPEISRIFEMSGFAQIFRIVSSKDALQSVLQAGRSPVGATPWEFEGLSIQYVRRDVGVGRLFVVGSQGKLDCADYAEEDVVSLRAEDIRFGAGLAAIGDRYEDYKHFFGESVVIHRHLYFYPAVKRPAVDFMMYAHGHSSLEYRFLHGFGFDGEHTCVLSFESREDFVALPRLVRAFCALSKARILGIVFMAESKGLWGMNLKRTPIIDNKPENGKEIFAPENFSEWINFPVEPADMNHVIVGVGIAIRDRDTVSAAIRSLIPKGQDFHIHACVLEREPFNRDMAEFDGEMSRVLTELEVLKVQHLLGQTRFSSGIAGITDLEESS